VKDLLKQNKTKKHTFFFCFFTSMSKTQRTLGVGADGADDGDADGDGMEWNGME
jgi:hypothetical protein